MGSTDKQLVESYFMQLHSGGKSSIPMLQVGCVTHKTKIGC